MGESTMEESLPNVTITEASPRIPDSETNVSIQTVPCSKCERNFLLERIKKHEEICTSIKPRKVYDIVNMRVKGTESEKLVKEGKAFVLRIQLTLNREIKFFLDLRNYLLLN